MGIICIDVDGTLTKDCCWTPEDCLKAEPRQEVIDKVNEIYLRHFIVIKVLLRLYLI